MTALDALMQSRAPRRVEPYRDRCWKGLCAKPGEGRVGLCPEHLDQLRDAEREEEP